MLKRSLFTFSAMLLATSALAQTAPKPDGVWRGSIGLNAAVSRGNSESTNIGLNTDAVRQTKVDKLGFYLQDIFASSKNSSTGESSVTAQIFRAGGRYDRDLTDRLFGFGGVALEHDKLADIKRRILPSVGLGYHVIKSEPTTFDVFAGVAYNDTTHYVLPKDRDAELLLGEESIHKISATTTFRQRLAMYAPFEDLSDKYRLQFDASLITQIVGGWSLNVTLTDRYQKQTAPGKKKNDVILFTGLQYAWGPK